eukprot:s151_g40.t1
MAVEAHQNVLFKWLVASAVRFGLLRAGKGSAKKGHGEQTLRTHRCQSEWMSQGEQGCESLFPAVLGSDWTPVVPCQSLGGRDISLGHMAKTVKFEGVGMTCSGCSGAIERILKKVDGVSSISCDIDGKTVTVEYDDAKTKPQDMWDKMKKWADAAQKELAPCPE